LFLILDESGPPKEILAKFFLKLIDNALSESPQRQGSFMANAATEFASFDANVAIRVEANNLDIEKIFYSFLLKTQ
jgi:hypothetical protein